MITPPGSIPNGIELTADEIREITLFCDRSAEIRNDAEDPFACLIDELPPITPHGNNLDDLDLPLSSMDAVTIQSWEWLPNQTSSSSATGYGRETPQHGYPVPLRPLGTDDSIIRLPPLSAYDPQTSYVDQEVQCCFPLVGSQASAIADATRAAYPIPDLQVPLAPSPPQFDCVQNAGLSFGPAHSNLGDNLPGCGNEDILLNAGQREGMSQIGSVCAQGPYYNDYLHQLQILPTHTRQSLAFMDDDVSCSTSHNVSGTYDTASRCDSIQPNIDQEALHLDELILQASPKGSSTESWSMVESKDGNTPRSQTSFEMLSDPDDFGISPRSESSGLLPVSEDVEISRRPEGISFPQRSFEPTPSTNPALSLSSRPTICVTSAGKITTDSDIVAQRHEYPSEDSPCAPTTRNWDLDGTKAGNPKKRKKDGKLTAEARENTKKNRRDGICVRCRLYKIPCDQGNPCQKCCSVEQTHRVFFQPCSREDIANVSLVRHGNSKFGQDRACFRDYRWIIGEQSTIEIRWTLPGNIPVEIPNFKLPCTKFDPSQEKGDLIAEEWQVKGSVTVVELPPYACGSDRELYQIVHAMVDSSRGTVEKRMVDNISDELAHATFQEAHRYSRAHDSDMVKLALRICSTATFCQGWGSIVGTETLGTTNVDNGAAGYCGTKPISPALCHQIDVVFVNLMQQDERKLVKELKTAIFQKRPKPWYEIFLTYFVIMWHLKFIHGEAIGFMNCRKRTDSAKQVSEFINRMAAEWHHSASNMLYHFRYVLRGFLPFQTARKDMEAVRTEVGLGHDAVPYMEKVVGFLNEKGMAHYFYFI
ncbi:hypothetical protein MPH_04190 [Macrophomina phaseolina MS6]|uniref:Zn(2)-C6 fungal-type domain-containing protein n=1 Tax=Macrophomina phaseolina (strain MS6) TaxID=1126212 RepID=K2R853_MACPH|nr:hypothetical protein MPH_04190 [Macrophomina phaseolina MS6]